mgnify:CR=1 FL=1
MARGPRSKAQWLIPTYAGNTLRRRLRLFRRRAHPHVCGEHLANHKACSSKLGSSPRMRGTLRKSHAAPKLRGLIPTYAGNTNYHGTGTTKTRAHPHVCGEHWGYRQRRPKALGSSPRMRGTHAAEPISADGAGLIPTYAGNTLRTEPLSRRQGAHPHVCGEHGLCHCVHRIVMGSSPRMRGTLKGTKKPPTLGGLIPTYAGNT